MLDLDTTDRRAGQVKLDVIADGGNEWIKVSTYVPVSPSLSSVCWSAELTVQRIKEARLMAEFREQDSYVNSDYDSDPDFEAGPDGLPTLRNRSPEELTNSLILQARTLVNAAKTFRRPQGLPQPRVRFVLNRMSEDEEYADSRIERTFQVIRNMGVDLVLGHQARDQAPRREVQGGALPTLDVLLDLSVLVALCCDSAHRALPKDNRELESRFRALRNTESGLELSDHNNVTRDLRDQLQWEMQHPLIGEIQTQLTSTLNRETERKDASTSRGRVQFWVTEEVKGRLPNIVDIIGGPQEKARAAAMFQLDPCDGEDRLHFWDHSRWKGMASALGDMRIKILPTDLSPDLSGLNLDGRSASATDFHARLIQVCENMLSPPADSLPSPTPLHKQKFRQSKNPKRPYNYYPVMSPASSRAPSPHTLNSFIAAAKRGWTVLTNNRGAVHKVMRDLGVMDGLPYERSEGLGQAVVWVVNPSSLSEWRRIEVEESNRGLLEIH